MERIVDDGAEDLDVHGRNDSTSETVALYKAMALKFEAPFHDHGGRARREGACCERIYGSPNVHCAIALPIVSDVLLQLRVVVDDALVRVTTIAHPIA